MNELYQEQMLDHYHNPDNYGVLEQPDIDVEMDNPTCGDLVHFTFTLDAEGCIADVMFEGHGCVVSMASSSMFTEAVKGKTPAEIETMGLNEIQAMMGGIRLSMGRIKCALLPLDAVKLGLKEAGKL